MRDFLSTSRRLSSTLLAILSLGCGGEKRASLPTAARPVSESGESSVPSGTSRLSPAMNQTSTVGPPLARRQEVVDVYHGVKVVDQYRWMEAPSVEREDWLAAQSRYARKVLGILPRREEFRLELREANRVGDRVNLLRVVGSGPRIFALRRGSSDETATLTVRDGWHNPDRVLVDPATLAEGSSHASIDFAFPSPDGRYVAYGISTMGSENSTARIIDVDSGQVLADRVERMQMPMISWRADSRSFFYWRRAKPRPDAPPTEWFKNRATFLHTIGDDPDIAKPVISAGMSKLGLGSNDLNWVRVTPGSRWAVAVVSPVIGKRSFLVAPLDRVRPGATPWRKVISADEQVDDVLVYRDRLYARTHADAPNYRVVSFDVRAGVLARANDFVPASDLVLLDFVGARDAMYIVALDRGVHRLIRAPWDEGNPEQIPLPFEGSISRLLADADRPGLIFSMEGWVERPNWFKFDKGSGVQQLPVTSSSPAIGGLVVEQARVLSPDGVAVALSIIRRQDMPLTGHAPAFLFGYGAYGTSMDPWYDPFTLTWVKKGGIYATCHVRGGGERGKSWHLAGIKEHKENGVDDFISCAEYLIDRRYTSKSRLTAITASAGGVVVGGAITKRPDLFTAAVLQVSQLNPLRKEVTEGGPAHEAEYGNVKVDSEFRSILASDPYHRIRDGRDYPAVLVTAGLHDRRIPVWIPAKFAARLQATTNKRPTFLRIEYDAGHGFGSTQSQREEEFADIFAFALWRSGT
jgi:prolyl oligopeptidase